MAAFNIPHLDTKLKKLYASGRNSEITKHEDLAAKLGITAKAIEHWIYGTGGQSEDAIPEKHIENILEFFNLEKKDLQSDDLRAFNKLLQRPPPGWIRLFQRAEEPQQSGRLRLYRPPHRGIGMPYDANDDVEGECLNLEEKFRLELQGKANWFVVTLVQDPDEIICLCPSRKYPDYRLTTNDNVTLPPAKMNPVYAIKPAGQHWVLAIFTQTRLPGELEQGLLDPLVTHREHAIDELDRWLERQNHQDYFVLRLAFYVNE